MPVLVYRLLEYSMNDVLFKNFGIEKTDEIFRQAGYLAKCEFAKNALPLDIDESTFISTLVQTLETLTVNSSNCSMILFDNCSSRFFDKLPSFTFKSVSKVLSFPVSKYRLLMFLFFYNKFYFLAL